MDEKNIENVLQVASDCKNSQQKKIYALIAILLTAAVFGYQYLK